MVAALFMAVGCGPKKSESGLTGAVRVDGSSTVYPITEAGIGSRLRFTVGSFYPSQSDVQGVLQVAPNGMTLATSNARFTIAKTIGTPSFMANSAEVYAPMA